MYFNELVHMARLRNAVADPRGKLDLMFYANEFGGEAGELQNALKKFYRSAKGVNWGTPKPPEELRRNIEDEFADVIICLANIAWNLDKAEVFIDASAVVERKFNETSDKIGSEHKLKWSY